ncbi:hypothetical protein ACRALDRAFT_206086 [Sodiomyces alcalophilus JCM 7366]|uniref:uncharacterized protein n=1 Tax=Sodiomyces alcalophilus JCM 7366 TaxID=591952 RepID=UPI0039B461A8
MPGYILGRFEINRSGSSSLADDDDPETLLIYLCSQSCLPPSSSAFTKVEPISVVPSDNGSKWQVHYTNVTAPLAESRCLLLLLYRVQGALALTPTLLIPMSFFLAPFWPFACL